MFWRRRREEDPFAALRGDGTPMLPGMAAAEPVSPSRSRRVPEGRLPGRILARRDTGVAIAGVPRLELTIEVRPEDGPPLVVVHRTVPPVGSASEAGDAVTVAVDRHGTVIGVAFRPAIRPRGG